MYFLVDFAKILCNIYETIWSHFIFQKFVSKFAIVFQFEKNGFDFHPASEESKGEEQKNKFKVSSIKFHGETKVK